MSTAVNTQKTNSETEKSTQIQVTASAVYGGTGATIADATKAAQSETTDAAQVRDAKGCDFKFTTEQQKEIGYAWMKWLHGIRQYHKEHLPHKSCPTVKSVSNDAMIVDSVGTQLRGRVVWFNDGQAMPFVFPDSCQEHESTAASSSTAQTTDDKKPATTAAKSNAGSGGSTSMTAIQSMGKLPVATIAVPNYDLSAKDLHSVEAARKRLSDKLAQQRAGTQSEKLKEVLAKLRHAKTAPDLLDYKLLNCGFAISREDGASSPIIPGTRVGFTATFVNGSRMNCSYAHWEGDEKKPLFDRLLRAHNANTLRVFFVPNPKMAIDERAMFVFVARANNQAETDVRRFLLARCKNPAQMPGTIWLHTVIGLEGLRTLSQEDRTLVEETAHEMNWNGYTDTPYMWNQGGHYEKLKDTAKPFTMEESDLSRVIASTKKPKKSKLARAVARSTAVLNRCATKTSDENSDVRDQDASSSNTAAAAASTATAPAIAPSPPTPPASMTAGVTIKPVTVNEVVTGNGSISYVESVTDKGPEISWMTSR